MSRAKIECRRRPPAIADGYTPAMWLAGIPAGREPELTSHSSPACRATLQVPEVFFLCFMDIMMIGSGYGATISTTPS